MKSAALIAFATSFALSVPVVRSLCNRWQLFNMPGPLKIHARPIPRLGGIAITTALAHSSQRAVCGTNGRTRGTCQPPSGRY
jgi:UDP-N-acetylmuramyl pentapeptide phosphotransferase/UDP-N-acetylglucosamine-1-phosphate transferase